MLVRGNRLSLFVGQLSQLGVVAVGFVASACVNSEPSDDVPLVAPSATGTGGASSSTDPTSSASATVAPVDTTMCGGDFTGYGDVMVSENCTNAAPVNCNISSFEPETYEAASDWGSDTWGDDTSLTGGAFGYVGTGESLGHELLDGALHVTGSVPDYAGWGFWFGPCHDASPFEGVQFMLSGDLGGGQLKIQVQTDENYPIEADKGACAFTDEAAKWDECKNNEFEVQGFGVNGLEYFIPWSEFTGGLPAGELHPNQLLGVQFQVNCGADVAPCAVDLQLHDLRFYRGHAAELGPEPEPVASSTASAEPAMTDAAPSSTPSETPVAPDAAPSTSAELDASIPETDAEPIVPVELDAGLVPTAAASATAP